MKDLPKLPQIDPVRYGALWERVQNYERRFDEMANKMDKLEKHVETLVALANKGRGGFWAGMLLVSIVSTLAGLVISWARIK